jgi:DNA-binding transcriptional MocR family regulator
MVDLLCGWPNPALLPVPALADASSAVLSSPAVYTPGLLYGPDDGYPPLRDHIARWLTSFYRPPHPIAPDRICISGGASQNLACVLQVFSDPVYTRNVWMVEPTYHLACRIMEDSGFAGRLRGVPEDNEGIDVAWLEQKLQASEDRAAAEGNSEPVCDCKTCRWFLWFLLLG